MSKEMQCSDSTNADIVAQTRHITGPRRAPSKIKGHKDGQGMADNKGGKG